MPCVATQIVMARYGSRIEKLCEDPTSLTLTTVSVALAAISTLAGCVL
jgi:hypothetical protein